MLDQCGFVVCEGFSLVPFFCNDFEFKKETSCTVICLEMDLVCDYECPRVYRSDQSQILTIWFKNGLL